MMSKWSVCLLTSKWGGGGTGAALGFTYHPQRRRHGSPFSLCADYWDARALPAWLERHLLIAAKANSAYLKLWERLFPPHEWFRIQSWSEDTRSYLEGRDVHLCPNKSWSCKLFVIGSYFGVCLAIVPGSYFHLCGLRLCVLCWRL